MLAFFAGLSLLAGATGAHAQEVNIQGATTVSFGLMLPKKADIEKISGQSLKILPSSTSRGLQALVAGNADIAMLAEPLDDAVASALKAAPGSVDASKLEGFHVANAEIQIIVNAANAVAKLTDQQVAGLLGGKIANWKEVGGADAPVLVVTEPTSAPHHLLQNLFKFTMSPTARPVQNASQTAQVVAQVPGAVSYLSTAHQVPDREKVKVLATDTKVPLELYIAIRKDAPAGVRKVVDAAKQVSGLK
ncbi:MAG: substrate-binding domain-containing protein [Proteobacteria bacterium]|nr:substrate-binding domain-containing protein [Pseudomonadota bacterium]